MTRGGRLAGLRGRVDGYRALYDDDVRVTRDRALSRRRVLEIAWLQWWAPKLGRDVNQRPHVPSSRGLSVLVPAIDRDCDVLEHVLASLRRHLEHPVEEVFVVGPDTPGVREVARRAGARFVLETDVEPVAKSAIDYVVDGEDRSGWLYQQLLKLVADQITGSATTLVCDADTVLTRPQVFLDGERVVFDRSVEHHQPYYDCIARLLGRADVAPLSFVAHHMVFESAVLQRLRAELAARAQGDWVAAVLAAVDRSEASGFSEYELYGNFMRWTARRRVRSAYWFNVQATRARLPELESLVAAAEPMTKTLSFHHHER